VDWRVVWWAAVMRVWSEFGRLVAAVRWVAGIGSECRRLPVQGWIASGLT